MPCEQIAKPIPVGDVVPNPSDYERVRARFSWVDAARDLDGLPDRHGFGSGRLRVSKERFT